MLAFFLDILLLAGLVILGYLICRSIVLDLTPWVALGIGFPLGAGIVSWFLFLLSWLGIPLNTLAIFSSFLVPYILFGGLLRYRNLRRINPLNLQIESPSKPGYGKSKWITVILFGLLLLTAAVIAVGRSYSTWDAIAIWAAKGYGISLEKTIFAAEVWGAHKLDYPLNIPILISIFRSLDGDLLPGSKLLFPFFYLSFLTGSYYFWRSSELQSGYAITGLLFIATIPVIFEHATIGYANLPFSVYLVLGTLMEIEGIKRGKEDLQLLGGLYLGLAGWTRPEGIILIPILSIAILLAFRLTKTGKIHFLFLFAPIVIVLGVWVIFARNYASEGAFGSAIQSLWASLKTGSFHLDSIYWIARLLGRQLLEIKKWGLILPLTFLLIIFQRSKIYPRQYPIPFVALVATIATALSITAFYYLVSYIGDLRFWLETGVNRMFLPAGLLASVWIVLYAGVPLKNNDQRQRIMP